MPIDAIPRSRGAKSIGNKLTLMMGATIALGLVGIVVFLTQLQERYSRA